MKFGKQIQDIAKRNAEFIAPIRYMDFKALKKMIKELKKVKKDADAEANATLKANFLAKCEAEMKKVQLFMNNEAKMMRDRIAQVPENVPLTEALDTQIKEICAELRVFVEYLDTNIEAYRKIGKKWDKNYNNAHGKETETQQELLTKQAEEMFGATLKEMRETEAKLFHRGGSITESLNDTTDIAKQFREMWSFKAEN
eukprot:JZ552598.1.p1 GENE.JZ552598.1~~JZ552598.1.p1  ORF type:complete len:199 (+),score=75.39 JZ552598.1:11-607(+)